MEKELFGNISQKPKENATGKWTLLRPKICKLIKTKRLFQIFFY